MSVAKTLSSTPIKPLMSAKIFVTICQTAKPLSSEFTTEEQVEATRLVIANHNQVLTAQDAMAKTGIWTCT